MKKLAKFLTLSLVLFVCGIVLIACGGKGGSENTKINLSASMFSGYKADFNNSSSLGIINKKETTRSSNKKNFFVGFDDENRAVEIQFRKISGNGIISQVDINAQIDKLYITNDYVFFTLTTNTSLTRILENYDQKNYISNANTQSFLIDRNNFNIYSLSQFASIISINKSIIQTGSSQYYKISIEQNQLVFTDLVPNKNITVQEVSVDDNNVIYVRNSTLNQITGNVVYFTYNATYKYAVSDSGQLYRSHSEYVGSNYITFFSVYDSINHAWKSPTFDSPMHLYFQNNGIYNDDILFKNNNAYLIEFGYVYIRTFKANNGASLEYESVTISTGGLSGVKIVGDDIYVARYVNSAIQVEKYNTSGTVYQITEMTVIIDGITSWQNIEYFKDYIIVTKEQLNGTQRYKIAGGIYSLISETSFDTEIIIIKPLN